MRQLRLRLTRLTRLDSKESVWLKHLGLQKDCPEPHDIQHSRSGFDHLDPGGRWFCHVMALVFLFGAVIATAQVKIEKKPIQYTAANDGHQMYLTYCATCHGQDGKGNGPAASALKRQPIDLTRLAIENGGRYPTTLVLNVLRKGSSIAAHGSSDMPVWGPLFQSLCASQGAQEAEIQLRIRNLTDYIKTLQQQ